MEKAKFLVPLSAVLLGYSWSLLVKVGLSMQALPLLALWISLVAMAFFPLFKENPLAQLIGKPLEGGWTFLWLSLPLLVNGVWGVQTQTLSFTHLAKTALILWVPYIFWHLGNLLKDRSLMDILLLVSLLLPWKLGFLDAAWPLGKGQAGFHAINGILSVHVGVCLLSRKFALLGLPLQHTKRDWLKAGAFSLILATSYFFLHRHHLKLPEVPFRSSLILEILTLVVVYGFIEELLFRGFILNWAKSVTASSVLSVLMSAGLGAAFSLMPTWQGAAAVGVASGILYIWTSSLLVCSIFGGVLRALVIVAFF